MADAPRVTVPVDGAEVTITLTGKVSDTMPDRPGWFRVTGHKFIFSATGDDAAIRLSAAPAPEGGAVLDAHDGDTPLQSAAREAGWALSSLIDSAPWERRGQLQGIVERLGAAIDRLVWPWPGDDVRHDEIRDAWRAYADERTDDDGKIDATEIDTCVAIGCMKAIQLLSPALATREEASAEAGELQAAIAFMEGAAVMLGRGEMPAPGSQYAATWWKAHAAVLSALRAQPQAREEAQPVACGGCGAKKPSDRCLGCFHDFYPTPPAPEAEKLRMALEWYGEQARLARLIHSEGDKGRQALADDGGKRARQALAALQAEQKGGA